MLTRVLTFVAALAVSAGAAQAATPAVVQAEPMFVAYPQDAFASRVEGRVAVELKISEMGAVEQCTVVERVAASLDDASCNFWRRAQFRAARDDYGRPVATILKKYSDWRLRN